jgi:hypothetical protein
MSIVGGSGRYCGGNVFGGAAYDAETERLKRDLEKKSAPGTLKATGGNKPGKGAGTRLDEETPKAKPVRQIMAYHPTSSRSRASGWRWRPAFCSTCGGPVLVAQ